MKHSNPTTMNALLRRLNRACDFQRWLNDEGESLIASADLLGGKPWATRAKVIVATAREGGDLAARRTTLVALHRLLEGRSVGLLEGPEAWRFSLLHPDDPRATRAMLCAEALGRGMRALEALRLLGISTVGGVE